MDYNLRSEYSLLLLCYHRPIPLSFDIIVAKNLSLIRAISVSLLPAFVITFTTVFSVALLVTSYK